jgi:hypothetical protein
MKKKNNKQIEQQNTVQRALPPWTKAKSKLMAYNIGRDDGELKVYREKEQEEKEQEKKRTQNRDATLLQLMHSTATLVDAVSHMIEYYKH